jgi:hypothetical protein
LQNAINTKKIFLVGKNVSVVIKEERTKSPQADSAKNTWKITIICMKD